MNLHPGAAPVSVIVPCFRCATTLERAVASVANQSWVPAEVILVEDCSGDGTRAAVQAIAQRYRPGWVQVILLDRNQGAANARNAAWATASQPYIAFLDADDAWHPEKIRIQLSYMQAHPEVALCGHAHRLQSGYALPDWPLAAATQTLSAQRITRRGMLASNPFVTPSVMLRRDIAQRFEDGRRHMEDHMLWLSILFSGAAVDRLPHALAAIYKGAYGHGGLSAQWWKMERGDLDNYRRLRQQGHISPFAYLGYTVFSMLKFVRRLVLFQLLKRGAN